MLAFRSLHSPPGRDIVPHTRWRPLIREFLGSAHREMRVSLARPLRPEKWLFLVGCYNSGTTLLASLLSRHPQIGSLPDEGQYLTDQLVCDYEVGLPRMWCERESLFRWDETHVGPDVARIRSEWAVRANRRGPVMMEKTPSNIARMRWLQANFENAYFVAIVRNGYAVAEGIRRKACVDGRYYAWPMELCARQWRRCAEVLAEDGPAIRHLKIVRYEDLAKDPLDTLGGILNFVGVDASLDVEADAKWSVHEREEAIRDLNQESICRLSEADVDAVERVASAELQRWGYVRPEVTGA